MVVATATGILTLASAVLAPGSGIVILNILKIVVTSLELLNNVIDTLVKVYRYLYSITENDDSRV